MEDIDVVLDILYDALEGFICLERIKCVGVETGHESVLEDGVQDDVVLDGEPFHMVLPCDQKVFAFVFDLLGIIYEEMMAASDGIQLVFLNDRRCEGVKRGRTVDL